MTPKIRNIAACDFIARRVSDHLADIDREWMSRGSKKRGFHISKPTQYVLERKSVVLTPEILELRLYVHMPAHGRRIDGRFAASLFGETLPQLVKSCLHFESLDRDKFYKHVECVEDQQRN